MGGAPGQARQKSSRCLDAATPKVWDHRSNEVAKKGGDALGIYELDGDNLKVASVGGTWTEKKWRGRHRPTQFRLPDAEIVIELRRAKAVK